MLRLPLRATAGLVLAFSLAACSATAPTSPVAEEPEYPVYETFDPSDYQASPAAVAGEAVHDVPERLMDGRVELPQQTQAVAPPAELVPRQVDGYRIQIFSSESRDSAERVRGDAATWLTRNPTAAGSERYGTPVVAYLEPYYRVRVGSFALEQDAREALDVVRRRYPEAFIIPDLVTVLAPEE